MKLISWNVQGSARDHKSIVSKQARKLLAAKPDVVAFQEMRRRRVPEWQAEFERAAARDGREWHVEHNQDQAAGRTNFAMVASRWPIIEVEDVARFGVPVPARVLAVTINVDGHPLQLINTHVLDGSSYKVRKVEHYEGLYRYLTRTYVPGSPPRILCGDFNEPRRIRDDGYVITWGQEPDGSLGGASGRWDAAVRSVLLGLRAFDLADIYADQPAERRRTDDWSWVAGNGTGRRYDHIFASAELRARRCGYTHEWREQDLSDHSAVWAEFDWPR